MKAIIVNIKPIMVVGSVLTCTMLYAALAPQAALQASVGAQFDGPLAQILGRNWGLLIALVGAMLRTQVGLILALVSDTQLVVVFALYLLAHVCRPVRVRGLP